MAITGRAARATLTSTFTTPDVVGPGSYIRTERDPPVHGFAPFSSTVERPGPEEGSFVKSTPGPGAYVTPLESTIGRTPFAPNGVPPGAGAAFASKVHRMPVQDHVRSAEPGPGRYSLRDDWNHVAATAHAQGTIVKDRVAARHPSVIGKLAGPPSIPVSEQSYGYEEVGEGELRRQRAPGGGYTGVSGSRSVGPGEYEPTRAVELTKPAIAQPSFGNSRVARAVFAENKDTPGPGSYAAEGSDGRGKPSAAFLSRVARPHQKLLDPEKLVPGPGHYASMPGITPKAVPESLQAFGTTQKRLASDAITPNERQRLAQPGPGAYEERRTDFAKAMDSRVGGASHAAPDAKGRSGFNSSTVRFQALQKGGKPGPGQYDQQDQHSFVANLQKRPHGRNGVFGSTTRRFHSLKSDAVPGAGAYDPMSVGSGEAERDEGPSSAFASGVQRFTKSAPTRVSNKAVRQKDAVPPPWQYNPRSENVWEPQMAHKAPSARTNDTFGSTVERFPAGELGGGVRVPQVPGPGQYAPKHPAEGFRKQQTTAMCFGTKEGRFGAAQRGIFSGAAPTPGPGQYESNIEIVDPMIKRSFNITIG